MVILLYCPRYKLPYACEGRMKDMKAMFDTRFGIEVEFTGITRLMAARAAVRVLGGVVGNIGGSQYCVTTADGRKWKFVFDGSISPLRRSNDRLVTATSAYRVEMVSPILKYHEDMENLQNIIRALRIAGGFASRDSGIHIHLDGVAHTPRSICNFVNIIASKNDLLYKALQIKPTRTQYCKKVDSRLVRELAQRKPKTFEKIADIWYGDSHYNRNQHYHKSRYHFLNLHSFFTGNHTVELRGFNSDLHAGKVRAYVTLALGLNYQAMTQSFACLRIAQSENDKFAMRTYLNRIGFIGAEFKNCREHLYKHLPGSSAWRYGAKPNNERTTNGQEV